MAINFSVGDKIVVKQAYVSITLRNLTQNANLRRNITNLQRLKQRPATVEDTGSISMFDRLLGTIVRSYIRVVPIDVDNPAYQNGSGVVFYFDDDDQLNNCFEISTAFLCDQLAKKSLNNTGATIVKNSVVRFTGFDASTQLPTIALASAAVLSTNKVFGIAEADIPAGAMGSILIEGAGGGFDTSLALINDTVFLSDTPGAISFSAGTTSSIVGRVHSVATDGAITVRGEQPFGEGAPGATGLGGPTGIQGAAGTTGLALGATGVRGDTGILGLQGGTGVEGVTGVVGTTGLSSGPPGVTGLVGPTGIQGIQGNPGSNGSNGAQGVTGLQGVGLSAFNTSAIGSASINAFPTRSSTVAFGTGLSNPKSWWVTFAGINVPVGNSIDNIIMTGGSINTSNGTITINYVTNDFNGINDLTTAFYGGAAN